MYLSKSSGLICADTANVSIAMVMCPKKPSSFESGDVPLLQIVIAGRDAYGDMKVQGPAGLEPRIDRGKAHDALLVRELPATQVGIIVGARDRADVVDVDLLALEERRDTVTMYRMMPL